MVFLKDGPHHQQMKVERRFKKKKEKKEKKPKYKSFAIFGKWVSGGEESSASSNDESSKNFTIRTNMGSSSNTCLMAQGMENDVSDDGSDSPSYDELLELVHKHQKVVKKQYKEIENLNDLNAILATNYEDLLCKFKLLSEKHEEFKLKIESINDTNDFLKMNQSIPCAIPISKIDASTSYIDLIDESCSNPCNEKCFENVFVESCDDLITKENDELKQEVERLMKDMASLKGKSIESKSNLLNITVKTW